MADLTDVEDIALIAMAEHLPSQWTFKWKNLTCRYGQCNFTFRRIELSKPLMQLVDDSEAMDTILHEIAHALVFEELGADHINSHGHHDAAWQVMCDRIGANPTRLGPRINNAALEGIKPAKWKFKCRDCGQETPRRRKPKYHQSRYSCLLCKGKQGLDLIRNY
jgi:predicted SprT family Zn-dependent metalloprotease